MGNRVQSEQLNPKPPEFIALQDDHIHLLDSNLQLLDKIPAKIEPIFELCVVSENIVVIYSTFTSEIIYIFETYTRTFLHKHYDFKSLCKQEYRMVYTTMHRMDYNTVLIHNTDIIILNIRTLTKHVIQIRNVDDYS